MPYFVYFEDSYAMIPYSLLLQSVRCFRKEIFRRNNQSLMRQTVLFKIIISSLQCRRILGGRNLVRVHNVVVAAIFDFMTVEDWGE